MTIQNIKGFSKGFGISSALISNWATLSEYKAGKVHLFYETLSRYAVVNNSLTFTKIVLEKLVYVRMGNQLQSKPIKWAIRLTPIALGYLKGRTQKTYPLLAKRLAHLENYVEKSSYVIFIIGSIALVRFGHFLVGYSALSMLIFNKIISNGFTKSHFPLFHKIDSVFKIYANPILGLVGVAISGSYLTIGYTLFSLALMTHASFIKSTYTIQKPQTNIESSSPNKLTLEKWKKFNTEGEKTFLTINRERAPKISLPSLNNDIDIKQSILNIFEKLPKILQIELITRINHLPNQTKIDTFEEAKSVAASYLNELISFTKEQFNPIWNTLLQQSCSMLQQVNNLDEQLLGIKELLFGSEGQCEIAQQRNLISGFITLAKINQITIGVGGLELIFNLCLADLSNYSFSFFLQAHLNKSLSILEKTIKMPCLINFLRVRANLTDMHTYQLYEKFYGSHFGIQSFTKDLTIESLNADIMSNPLLYIFMKYLFKLDVEKISDIYFTTQLQKITLWLRNQIALKQILKTDDISTWFYNWIKSSSISDKEKVFREFTEDGTIAGHRVCYMDSGDMASIALISFLYEMDVFTDATSSIPWLQKASIEELIESLKPNFDLQVSSFEKNLNNLDAIGIENPSLAKTYLLGYLFSSKESLQASMSQFMDSLNFSKQGHISIEKQDELTNSSRDKATQLKEKIDKLDFKTRTNLEKHVCNLIDLKYLDPELPEVLFV
ncbi:MAG: hypothetical protein ACH349_03950 [Candidatus Rhabdochlamydia sp.]|jgi:hypothetical protein|nr:hypothetical protein [Chlamydiota bacterium]